MFSFSLPYVSSGRSCVLLLIFSSPRYLRPPSDDCHDTLPHDRKYAYNFIIQVPKFGGPPLKQSGCQKCAKFRAISHNFRLRSQVSPKRLSRGHGSISLTRSKLANILCYINTRNETKLKLTNRRTNKHQSNLVKGGIAFCLYSPGGSSNLQLHVLSGTYCI